MNLPERPITILIAALGGEGGGVMADWLMEAATKSDLPAQATSIPGVAQRTGATTYYLEIYPAAKRALGERFVVGEVFLHQHHVVVVEQRADERGVDGRLHARECLWQPGDVVSEHRHFDAPASSE